MLGEEKERNFSGKDTGIDAKDLSNTLPGDLLETTEGEHDIKKVESAIQKGGVTNNKGQGGERVWKNSLDPDEKKALKNFFE